MEIQQPEIKKKPREGIIDMKKMEVVLEVTKKYLLILKGFFWNKQNETSIVIIVAILSCSFLGYNIVNMVTQSQTLDKQTVNLEKLEKYNIQSLKDNPDTQNAISNVNEIWDLLKLNDSIQKETQRYGEHKKDLQSSYTNFLQYLLVPKLNIRKEAYIDKINTDLVGENFLDNNPFNDINLYQKWSDFFGSTEKNQLNKIDALNIGEITETDFGLYSMKISLKFSAPSKNALLFLVDKITTTSDKNNISLLGEFVYYLRQEIKVDKKTEIQKLVADPSNKEIAKDEDKVIGKSLYNWVLNAKNTNLIDESVINKTVQNIMECGTQTDTECFYKFRDKFRNIPEIAYTIWNENNMSKTNDLRDFFKNMPPLMAVQNFTYNKIIWDTALAQSTTYDWKIELEVYGQNISQDDIQEISKELNKKCLGKSESLGRNNALVIVKQAQAQLNKDTSNKNGTADSKLNDLRAILEDIWKWYQSLSNYEKTIKIFEIYRMLNEGWFCTTI